MKKILVALLAVSASTAALAQSAAALAQSAAPVARTETGAVRGTVANGIVSWKGIPFAAPPVGPLRWRAPQPAARWPGVRETTTYRNDCMQEPFGGDAAPLGTPPAEDCLYLNVWKPAGAPAKLPVILWIYGGGFINGGSSPPTYSGANLAKKGVMVVSFNYRVGRFGTFGHPALTRAHEDGGLAGNFGYLDQVAALKWVRRNIAAFGGDPANITVIGESAGGMSVHMVLTSPMTRGLVKRAVVMSGGDGQGMATLGSAGATPEQVGAEFIASKGIAADDPQALAKMRALTAVQVTDGLSLVKLFGGGKRTFSSPFADGRIAVDVAKAYKAGAYTKVPVMIGATSADIGGNTGSMIAGARTLSGEIAKAGVSVYAYRFSYVAQSIPTSGASHASDIPFFFDTQGIKYGAATTPRDTAMGDTISDYLVNFAKTGNPNGGTLPQWPRYDAKADVIMDFAADGQARAGRDPLIAGK
jgi:para-nitrobenzyl esterase